MTPSENGKSSSTQRAGRTRAWAFGRKVVHAYVHGLGFLAGSSLVLVGLSRRSLGGLALAAGGAALVSRTITGVWLPGLRNPKSAAAEASPEASEAEDATARDLVDEAGYDSFPASDPPPAYSPR